MQRPSKKAREIHRAAMPMPQEQEEKMSEKDRQKQDRQISFDIQQNMSR